MLLMSLPAKRDARLHIKANEAPWEHQKYTDPWLQIDSNE